MKPNLSTLKRCAPHYFIVSALSITKLSAQDKSVVTVRSANDTSLLIGATDLDGKAHLRSKSPWQVITSLWIDKKNTSTSSCITGLVKQIL